MTETRHGTYDELVEDFGRRLQEAATRRAGRQRRRRRAAAGVLVMSAIAAGTLLLTAGGGRLDVVAQAKAALAPAGHIVHLITTSHMEMRGGSPAEIVGPEAEDNTPRVTERWSTSEPTRWRVATTVPIVGGHGTSTGPVQLSYGDGTEELYIQSLNTLDITTGVRDDSLHASLSGGPLGLDPVARIRSMLGAGQLHDAGSGNVDGRAVRRLVGDELTSPLRVRHAPWPVEYDVDPLTYAPVRFTVEDVGMRMRGNPGNLTTVVDVNTYEVLPLNDSTESLLSVKPRGNATVRHDQDGQEQREDLIAQSERRGDHGQRPKPGRKPSGA
jgi:hypothetical protein